jgi:hypothetical protein
MLTWRVWFCGVIVAVCGVANAPQAHAQRSLNTGVYPPKSGMTTGSSGGMFGSSGTSVTGTGTGGTGFGMSSGQTGMGTGQTGMGRGQTGMGGTNTGMGTTQGATGFLGANNNPNNFLGRNTQGQQGGNNNQFGQGGRGGGQRGMDQSLQNLLNGGGQYGQSNANSRTPTVRPRQKIAFDHPTFTMPVVVQGIGTRFAKMSTRYPHLKTVELTPGDNGVVVLRGTVDSLNTAKVTESLVRLEPGVKSVQNELTFPPPAAAE